MRLVIICVCWMLWFGSAVATQSQAPEAVEAARQAASSALPRLHAAGKPTTMLLNSDSSALGCQLIAGLPLPNAIDVYRVEFPLEGTTYAVHVSVDGSMVQLCDRRFVNLGAGTVPVQRESSDRDGDGLPDEGDACPWVAGIAGGGRSGCPAPTEADRDGDEVRDSLDDCPDQAGATGSDGCALMSDEDGDGVPDQVDICSADFGIVRPGFALGCPADGSGSSTRRRGASDDCRITGDAIAIFASRAKESAPTSVYEPGESQESAGIVLGRSAASDWYELADGWARAGDLRLTGACYNIPVVNAAVGEASGCFMRPLRESVNVREAPGGKQVGQISAERSYAVLGGDFNGDWLFFRAGWVRRGALELAGTCERLPILNPQQVASGSIHFCPPGYSGFLRPRIDIGEGNARIASQTFANRLRTQPDIAAELIGEIPPGQVLEAVLDGPACQDSFVWWQVRVDGLIGWTVESDINANYYYLEPVASNDSAARRDLRAPSEQGRPATERMMHSAKSATSDTIELLSVAAPQAIDWSPSGGKLAVLNGAGEVEIYSAPDFAPESTELGLPDGFQASTIAFSPDERWLAIGALDGGVMLSDLSGEALALGELDGAVVGLAWFPAGDQLAAISGAEALRLVRRAGTLKLWRVTPAATAMSELSLYYSFPYPLTALAFNADGRYLAVTGVSREDRRASLWIYQLPEGDLIWAKALIYADGGGAVVAAPDAALGDFLYSSGDSLYQVTVASGEDVRVYQRAGEWLGQLALRPQVLAGAEVFAALVSESPAGSGALHLVNLLNAYSPSAALHLEVGALAFSPDGRRLAAAEPERDRIFILGATRR